MTILVSSHILEELYQTATEFILLDHGNIIEEISDHELNERCKRHIAIQTTDVQKAVMVLEENLHTDHFKLMPDGTIRLYDHLDDLEMVASVLSEAHVLVTGLFVSGDTFEVFPLLSSNNILLKRNVKIPIPQKYQLCHNLYHSVLRRFAIFCPLLFYSGNNLPMYHPIQKAR